MVLNESFNNVKITCSPSKLSKTFSILTKMAKIKGHSVSSGHGLWLINELIIIIIVRDKAKNLSALLKDDQKLDDERHKASKVSHLHVYTTCITIFNATILKMYICVIECDLFL